MVHGMRKFFLRDGAMPTLPPEFSSKYATMDPLDILAFYIIDEDFLHPLLLQATVFEYEVIEEYNALEGPSLYSRLNKPS